MEITDITVPVLEAVGNFFGNQTNYLMGFLALVVLFVTWIGLQVHGWRKALRMKSEGDVSIQAAQLEVQQAILQRLNDQSISEQERSVLLQQLSRPGRN